MPVVEAIRKLAEAVRVKVDDRGGHARFQVQRLGNARRTAAIEVGRRMWTRAQSYWLTRCPGREGKSFVPQVGLLETVQSLLATIQSDMLKRATGFREALARAKIVRRVQVHHRRRFRAGVASGSAKQTSRKD
jgi:hypothetical protein